jgi:16S rRNA (uracil1498-N3)-methyltransferase
LPADGAPSLVYVPDLATAGDEVTLPADEVHYLRRVCRVRPGERVRASDGAGLRAWLEVGSLERHSRARVHDRERDRPTRTAWVLCGAPEHHRADWLVEKLAELGVHVFQPLDLERARFDDARERRERWERLTIAALRQSRSAWRLEVREPLTLGAALATLPEGAERWVADPDGAMGARPAAAASIGVIGASQGFADHEAERLAAAGFQGIALSPNRLRTETAAVAWAAWWGAAGS